MEVRAITRFARISPFKARETARRIQGLPAAEALELLEFIPRKASGLLSKTLKSAMANAENNNGMSPDVLVIKEAVVNEGPMLRRYRARARGGAGPIRKRMSHIRIVLTEVENQTEASAKKAAKNTGKKKTAKSTTRRKPAQTSKKKADVKEEKE